MQSLDFKAGTRPDQNEQMTIEFGIDAANLEAVATARLPISVTAYSQDTLAAGVTGYTMGGTLIIKALWVDTIFRSQGVARNLMDAIEREAQSRGCKTAFVDTMTYQAPDLYARLGYVETARIAGFQDDHDRIFLQKFL